MKWIYVQTWFLLKLKSYVKTKPITYNPSTRDYPAPATSFRCWFGLVLADCVKKVPWLQGRTWTSTLCLCLEGMGCIIQGVQLKSGPYFNISNLFTTHITQLTWIYSKCWKWCPFISVHLSIRFTMFLLNHFRNSTFYWRLPSKLSNKTFLQWT
jgi:hypothetical protein